MKPGRFEKDRIEYKESKNKLPGTVYKTISAFANTKGGKIVLGVKQTGDDGISKLGVSNPQKLVDDLVSTIGGKYNFCPVVRPEIKEENDKYFVEITVQEASVFEKPIYIMDAGPIKGGYKRVGSSDINLNDNDVKRFYQAKLRSLDAQVLDDTTLDDVDERTFEAYRNLRKLEKDNAREIKFDNTGILDAYKLLSKNRKHLNVAGLLLFGKKEEIKRHLSHFRVDIIRIKGTEWGKDKDSFLSVDLQDNLINLRSQIIDHLDRFYLTPFQLNQELARVDVDPFKKALREATSNLLMHQNYLHHSPSQIIIYNDRIEFRNPGYSLKNPEEYEIPGSELRNTLIAPIFYDLGWADTKGTGIKTEILILKELGYPEVNWVNNERSDNFALIFPYPTDQVAEQATEHVTEQATEQAEIRDRTARILKFCESPKTRSEIILTHREHFRSEILMPLLDNKLLKMTKPDKPKSPNQKYVTVTDEMGSKGS